MRNLSYENEYDLHSNGLVSKTHFHMKGFALGLVLKQRQKRTRKWPIKMAAIEGESVEDDSPAKTPEDSGQISCFSLSTSTKNKPIRCLSVRFYYEFILFFCY